LVKQLRENNINVGTVYSIIASFYGVSLPGFLDVYEKTKDTPEARGPTTYERPSEHAYTKQDG
jgi:hypothetical protein